jgi:hypothetical protein
VSACFVNLDKVVEEYNEVYFKPVKKMLDDLYLLKAQRTLQPILAARFFYLINAKG